MTAPSRPIRLYRFALSGHSHRVELFLSLLGLRYEPVDVDLARGAHKTPEFLAKNPFGQVPVIEDGGITLADSNAILVYLARRYDGSRQWLPDDPIAAAEVQRWLSVAAGELVSGPAAARLAAVFGVKLDREKARALAAQLYAILDRHLVGRPFLVGAKPTIADVAIYSYTAHANEGGVSLEPCANVCAWLTRVEALPGFVAMQRTQVAA
jgi:glutathione S-transferase